MEKMVKVVTFPNELEAQLAQATLLAAGIESVLKFEDAGGMFPSLDNSDGVELLVDMENMEEATNLLTKESHPSEDMAV